MSSISNELSSDISGLIAISLASFIEKSHLAQQQLKTVNLSQAEDILAMPVNILLAKFNSLETIKTLLLDVAEAHKLLTLPKLSLVDKKAIEEICEVTAEQIGVVNEWIEKITKIINKESRQNKSTHAEKVIDEKKRNLGKNFDYLGNDTLSLISQFSDIADAERDLKLVSKAWLSVINAQLAQSGQLRDRKNKNTESIAKLIHNDDLKKLILSCCMYKEIAHIFFKSFNNTISFSEYFSIFLSHNLLTAHFIEKCRQEKLTASEVFKMIIYPIEDIQAYYGTYGIFKERYVYPRSDKTSNNIHTRAENLFANKSLLSAINWDGMASEEAIRKFSGFFPETATILLLDMLFDKISNKTSTALATESAASFRYTLNSPYKDILIKLNENEILEFHRRCCKQADYAIIRPYIVTHPSLIAEDEEVDNLTTTGSSNESFSPAISTSYKMAHSDEDTAMEFLKHNKIFFSAQQLQALAMAHPKVALFVAQIYPTEIPNRAPVSFISYFKSSSVNTKCGWNVLIPENDAVARYALANLTWTAVDHLNKAELMKLIDCGLLEQLCDRYAKMGNWLQILDSKMWVAIAQKHPSFAYQIVSHLSNKLSLEQLYRIAQAVHLQQPNIVANILEHRGLEIDKPMWQRLKDFIPQQKLPHLLEVYDKITWFKKSPKDDNLIRQITLNTDIANVLILSSAAKKLNSKQLIHIATIVGHVNPSIIKSIFEAHANRLDKATQLALINALPIHKRVTTVDYLTRVNKISADVIRIMKSTASHLTLLNSPKGSDSKRTETTSFPDLPPQAAFR